VRNLLLACAALVAAAGIPFTAGAQSAMDQARSSGARQGQIQTDTQKLGAELDSMIDEYERNGLGGDDVKNLKSLRAIISKLSDQDMQKILTVLQDAAAKKDPRGVFKALADAYSQQKGVLVQLKKIIAAYTNDQEALELSDSVKQLAERQAANLQTGIETAQWALGGKHDQEAIDASMDGQAAEQKAIGEELKLLNEKIEKFAKDPGNKALADRFNAGLQQTAKVVPAVDAAAEYLDQKKLFEAVTNEKTARDQMRALARTIAPPGDEATALREAAEELDKLIAQQKESLATTEDAITKPPQEFIADQFKEGKASPLYNEAAKRGALDMPADQMAQQDWFQHRYAAYKKSRRNLTGGLEDREGDLVNQDDALSQALEKIAKPAAEALSSAMPPMQTARTALTDKDSPAAATAEGDALAAMEKAKADLEQQLAAARKADEKSADPLEALRDLQKKTQDLLGEQTALAKDAAAPKTPQQAADAAQKQSDLEQKAQQLQQQAASDAPAAAQPLANAANNMQQAAGAMSNPSQNAQAQSQQAQAAQNLAKANNQLNQQANQLQQAQQELAAAEKALGDLAKIIAAEEKVHVDTGLAAPKQAKEPDVVRALAPAQLSIQNDTADFQKTLVAGAANQPGNPDDAKTVESAGRHMGDACGNLGKADGTKAGPDEAEALKDLYALRDKLQAAMAAAAQAAGVTPDAAQQAQADAQAAAALAQAQAETAQAQAAMAAANPVAAAAPPAAAAQAAAAPATAAAAAPVAAGAAAAPAAAAQAAAAPLAQAATDVGAAAAPAGLPADAQQSMQAANQDLAAASAQAAAGQDAQAQASAAQAQAAMAQATAALAQAQAGIGSNPGEPSAPGTPGSPSSSPPLGPGPSGGQSSSDLGSQGGGDAQAAASGPAAGKAGFLALPERDRATIQQSQSEKYPQEYATRIEQYLRNLADESSHP